MYQNIQSVDRLKLSVFAKICATCGEKFVPKNRKRIFCGPYCKQVWHYEKLKIEFPKERYSARALLTMPFADQPVGDFDILIATPVVPDPKNELSPKQIADKMIEKNYQKYFRNNQANMILTDQDEQILELLSINA